MELKTILVHLDHSQRCATRVAVAARLARTHGSHLVGLLPTGLYSGIVPSNAIQSGTTDAIAEAAEILLRRADAVAAAFERQALDAGLPSHELRRVEGMNPESVVFHGRASDLVVLGQGDRAKADDVLIRALAQEVMFAGGRPVLMIPFAGSFEDVEGHAVIAWDASREAARAVADALPLLARASRVTLLSLRRDPDLQMEGRLLAPEVGQWLLRHGIRADFVQHVTGIGTADALLSCLSDLGASLLVMGGYGHARARQRLLGGVTRSILAEATVPVLLSH
jgi:nucleotide-binding universal stress UspA family protein